MKEERELRNLFNRILFASVFGVVTAHLSHFNNPVFISFHSVAITMAMKKYELKLLLEKLGAIAGGLLLGVLATELFIPFPHLESLMVYIIFVTTLKLFAHDYKPNTVFFFNFSFMYTSIFSSYLEAAYENEVSQYLWELFWVFLIVTLAFKLFPSRMEVEGLKNLEKPRARTWEICFFSLILTIIWSFSMLFEWRFAFFAYVSLISLFTGFDMKVIGFKAVENIKTHFKACSITAPLWYGPECSSLHSGPSPGLSACGSECCISQRSKKSIRQLYPDLRVDLSHDHLYKPPGSSSIPVPSEIPYDNLPHVIYPFYFKGFAL